MKCYCYRDPDNSNDEIIEIDKYSDEEFDLHSDKYKLGTTIVENEPCYYKMYVLLLYRSLILLLFI